LINDIDYMDSHIAKMPSKVKRPPLTPQKSSHDSSSSSETASAVGSVNLTIEIINKGKSLKKRKTPGQRRKIGVTADGASD